MKYKITHTLVLKTGCRDKYDVLRVRMRMMSSFSEEDKQAYEMSKWVRFNKDGGIYVIQERSKIMSPSAVANYMELLFRRISYLFEDGYLKITCSSERYYKYEICEGVLNLSTGSAPELMHDLINEICNTT